MNNYFTGTEYCIKQPTKNEEATLGHINYPSAADEGLFPKASINVDKIFSWTFHFPQSINYPSPYIKDPILTFSQGSVSYLYIIIL